jgi:hypothetical protein
MEWFASFAFFAFIALNPWKIIGLLGSFMFGSRFILQWIASERARKSIIPIGFWDQFGGQFTSLELFYFLSPGLCRDYYEPAAAPDVYPQPVSQMVRSTESQKGKRTCGA